LLWPPADGRLYTGGTFGGRTSTQVPPPNGFIAGGSDAVTATQRAYVTLHGMLVREASMVSFVMLFRLLGVVFLLLVPLVFIMRRPKGASSSTAAH
jgi:hypothetical protein